MGLIAQAQSDIAFITSNENDFGVTLTLVAPDTSIVTVSGLHTKHHLAIDNDGKQVNSRSAHVSFSESLIGTYPLRNSDGQVYLKGHKVSVQDSTGRLVTYTIREWFPDETIGLIVCILGDFA